MSLDLIEDSASVLRAILPGEVAVVTSDPGVSVVTTESGVRVEGTGDVVVQVVHGGPWRAPIYNSANNEVVHFNVYADCSRTTFREPIKDDADMRAFVIYEQIDRVFHDVNHELRHVLSSYRRQGPTLTLIPNGDGAVLLTAEYETRR